jgi:ElaB/YqjD/DUF883 family membrane-anchored ribosome-binding protein
MRQRRIFRDGNGGSRSTAEKAVLEAMMQLVEELSRLLGDIDRLIHGLTTAGVQAGSDSMERTRQGIGQVRAQLDDLRERLHRELKRSTRNAERTIREHPFQSVAIAAAAGLLVGVLVARKP